VTSCFAPTPPDYLAQIKSVPEWRPEGLDSSQVLDAIHIPRGAAAFAGTQGKRLAADLHAAASGRGKVCTKNGCARHIDILCLHARHARRVPIPVQIVALVERGGQVAPAGDGANLRWTLNPRLFQPPVADLRAHWPAWAEGDAVLIVQSPAQINVRLGEIAEQRHGEATDDQRSRTRTLWLP